MQYCFWLRDFKWLRFRFMMHVQKQTVNIRASDEHLHFLTSLVGGTALDPSRVRASTKLVERKHFLL